ncbi:MAG: FtsX-like permease family protein [Candidatus Bathyarchaeia archaeon]
MNVADVLSYAFGAIKLRKLRAALTTLGVIIGIAAIVALLSFSQGFQNTITAQLQKGFATNTLIVSPSGGLGGGAQTPLLVSDVDKIDSIENVSTAVAIMQKTCFINVSDRIVTLTVVGVDFEKYESIYESTFVPANGTIPTNPQNDFIVIGARIHDPWQNGAVLADVGDALNITWTKRSDGSFQNKTYTGHVIAVLKEIGGFSVGGPSDFGVYIPIAQAQEFFETNECNAIVVLLDNTDKATIESVSNAIKEAFSNQVSVTSATAVLDIISTVFSSVEFFLAGIAGISLLVAGVGIMNIMIVSLMERTREIGILKALGMKNRTVLTIFLSEAIIIGLLGAVIGIFSGWGLANIVARLGIFGGRLQGANQIATAQISIMPVLTPTVLIGALAFGVIVSVVFGLYPAWRASKLKPVDALRYE